MEIEKLNTPQVMGDFDFDGDRIVRVTYRGKLSPDVTRTMYAWLGRLVASVGGDIRIARGSIYDFRQVTDFDSHNLTSAQRQSSNLKTQVDADELRHHPVALLINSLKQEQFVKLNMQIVGREERQRVVRTEEEAVNFIENFHKTHAPE
ncbi:MAG: hypothetical protein J0L63_15090 [Anaerolineae bacterium]|nr:hypothetical protein [Anaerolineae bacterium]